MVQENTAFNNVTAILVQAGNVFKCYRFSFSLLQLATLEIIVIYHTATAV